MKLDNTQTYHHLKSLSRTNRLQLLKVLSRLRFSGQLIWSSPRGQQWVFLLSSGDILYAAGGLHPRRRRYRYLQPQYAPLCHELNVLTADTAETPELIYAALQEYSLLSSWVEQERFAAADHAKFIRQIISEILFDVVQVDTVRHELYKTEDPSLENTRFAIPEETVVETVKTLWQDWSGSGLESYSPSFAPIIVNPEAMQAAVSPQAYRGLTVLLDGKQSLRDLATKTKREILQFTQALKPYLEAGWLELIKIPDHPSVPGGTEVKRNPSSKSAPLIACIDDSPMICQSVGQVIKSAGYEFISITEATRAIKMLLIKRPSLIFLDLVMPDTNGYEICSQLRKISLFKETPIIILSGNDGLVDQVRARLLGATDFLSKPMEPVVILSVIQKYLGQIAMV
ncbi:response regulator [Pseudanabaena sp. FACHB-2040]|uniref:response regulator n=1 Tax=Pseudanabaena sp. FACHB-2040 TaxID=2692859 RepID=UPI0016874A6F|nr:response regulator [Pseudanabaena sp. FACHB-2040]MBD2257760.1 response regulator [Pseudanabaena sp. FACHB-2040]